MVEKENKEETVEEREIVDSKWKDEGIQNIVKHAFDKIREEKAKAEQEIYDAIKKFEWRTNIKVIKIDFEAFKNESKAKLVLERFQ